MARNADGTLIRPRIRFSSEVITEQKHAKVNDPGTIARAVLAGELPPAPAAVFRDTTSDPTSLQHAFDLAEQAMDVFESLDPALRLEAGNNPVRLRAMLDDEDEVRRLQDAGLLPSPPPGVPEPLPVENASPTAAPPDNLDASGSEPTPAPAGADATTL